MKIVVAPDSFKSSVSASECAAALGEGIHSILPNAQIVSYPLADGGEGTLEVLAYYGFQLRECEVTDAGGRPTSAQWALGGTVAVIESAQATRFTSGASAQEAVAAGSHGVGMLILDALDEGATEIVLTLGGTGSTDGGIGMLQALGGRFTDSSGSELEPGGGNLGSLVAYTLSGLDERLKNVTMRVLSDVSNPLVGPTGAARVFAPQKGADVAAVSLLEQGCENVAALMGTEAARAPGSGAGGGLGFAAMVAFGVQPESGARVLLNMVGAQDDLSSADLIITGEGSFDSQSLQGKLTGTVIDIARHNRVPCIVVCGVMAKDVEGLSFPTVIPLSNLEPDPALSMTHARELLVQVGVSIGQDLLGQD